MIPPRFRNRLHRIALTSASLAMSVGCARTPMPSPKGPSPSGAPAAPSDPLVPLLVSGDFAAVTARFDPSLAATVPTSELATVWASCTRDLGRFNAVADTRAFPRGSTTTTLTLLRFDRGVAELKTTSAAGHVVGITLRPGDVELRALPVVRAAFAGRAEDVYGAFGSGMRRALDSVRWSETIDALRERLGALDGIDEVDVRKGRYDVATAHCVFSRGAFMAS